MDYPVEMSRRDETLALGLYTGEMAAKVTPQWRVVSFDYVIHRDTILDDVADRFGDSFAAGLTPEHRELLKRGEPQLPEDLELAGRMQRVQVTALTR